MFVAAVSLQTGLRAREHYRQQRQEVLIADLRASIVTSQRLAPCFGPRMLDFTERRIKQSQQEGWLSPRQQRDLLQLVSTERVRQQQERVAFVPNQLDQWAGTGGQLCPW
ncbi:hypothetical protein [Anatilimnocola aggregata]|nr:hypothetical protein [Anatilimnocola aggregata]